MPVSHTSAARLVDGVRFIDHKSTGSEWSGFRFGSGHILSDAQTTVL